MKIALFSFTDRGERLAEKLCDAYAGLGHTAVLQRYGKDSRAEELRTGRKDSRAEELRTGWKDSRAEELRTGGKESSADAAAERGGFREAVGKAFRESDALVFVGAAGIAVRGIAPYIMDKYADPAVVSVDEFGRYAVPLLSGHVGGANRLAELTAEITGGIPVISTASDLNHVFAVDVWAEKHFLTITDRVLAKEVTAALLRGENVGFFSDVPVQGELPEGLILLEEESDPVPPEVHSAKKPAEKTEGCGTKTEFLGMKTADFPACIYVTYRSAEAVREQFGQDGEKILRLVPRCLSLGCGCKKDFDPAEAVRRATEFLKENGIDPEAVMEVATIDLKEKEPALRAVAGMFAGIFRLHSAAELASVPGEFHDSEFVKQTVGVGNVCERAAMIYGSELLAPKTSYEGITFALSLKIPSISFR